MAKPRTDRERQIDEELVDLRRLADLAESLDRPADAVKAIERIGRLRAESVHLKAVRAAHGMSDPVARLRRLSEIATSAASWTAASDLSRAAVEAELEKDRIGLLLRQTEMEDMTLDQLVDIMVEAVEDLPPEHLDRMRAAMARREAATA